MTSIRWPVDEGMWAKERRERIIISMTQSVIIASPGLTTKQAIEEAVRLADALIAELDKDEP